MTYHDFLRAVTRSVNKPGVALTLETYDHALANGLKRLNPDLHTEAVAAIGIIDPSTKEATFRIPQLMHYLERNWPASATSATT